MAAPTPTLINLDDTTPAAPAGRTNVHWLKGTPFLTTIVYQGQTITVLAANVSASSPNPGSGGTSVAVSIIPLAPTVPGNFTVPHGLGVVPAFIIVQMESGGEIWEQSVPFDATNLYLTASDGGITGFASVWLGPADAEISLAPPSAGPFSVPHGLTGTPALALVQMTSSGAIWFQTVPWDATNLYLDASDILAPSTPITGKAEVWLANPNIAVSGKATIPVAPSGPGFFTVPHGLGQAPTFVLVRMKTSGEIWLQVPPWDTTNVYLVASDYGLAADLELWSAGSGAVVPSPIVSAIQFVIDGGGSPPGTGVYGQISIPYNCTILGWTITADQTGDAVIDVLRSTFAGFPTTASIAGTDKPTLSSAQKNQDSTLSGWGATALNAGDELQINLNSVTTCQRLNLTIKISVP